MSLDLSLQKLAENEQTYRPGEEAMRQLKEKELVMLVAPSGMGKSTLMNKLVENDKRFARVRNATTRPERQNDEPGLYAYLPHNEEGIRQLAEQMEKKELIQYAIFPATGYIYFTYPESYKATYNLLDTQAHVVKHLRRLPFRRTHAIGLVTAPEAWQSWLLTRYDNDTPELQKRLGEAISSLEWLLAQPEEAIHWAYNYPGNIQKSAEELTAVITRHEKPHRSYREYAEKLLSLAKRMKK